MEDTVAPLAGSVDRNSPVGLLLVAKRGSLPLRGAWIEIATWRRRSRRPKSLPLRGAWIEIMAFWVGML